LTIAYVIVIQWGGYTLTSYLFLLAALFILGTSSRKTLFIIPLSISLIGYIFFIAMLDTNFPEGPIEHFLNRLF